MSRYFERTVPEEQGVRSAEILSFLKKVEEIEYNMNSFLMIRHGKVIAQVCRYPFRPEHKRLVYSVSKTFTSTAIGIAVKEHLLDPEDKILSFFPEYENLELDMRVRKITIRNLLMMACGHGCDSVGDICNGDKDWIRTFLTREMCYEPGEKFVYNSGGTYMLSEILTRVTGQRMDEYLQERLFEPLDIREFLWDRHENVNTGAWGVLIQPEDLAKLGLMYLQNGTFGGKQILDKEWIDEATAGLIATGAEQGAGWSKKYGYQIWRNNDNSYRADGAFGQFCMVFPEEDMVIVTTAEETDPSRIFPLIEQHLLHSLSSSPYGKDAIVHGLLKKQIAKWETPQTFLPTESYIEEIINHKCIHFHTDDGQQYEIAFSFYNSELEVCIDKQQTIKSSSVSYLYGASEYVIMPPSVSPILQEPQKNRKWQYAARHEWINDSGLLLTVSYPETGHKQQWMFLFANDQIEVVISNSSKRLLGPFGIKSDRNVDFADIMLRGEMN